MASFFHRLGIRKDRAWVRHSFLLPSEDIEKSRQEYLTYSTSFYKYTDTRIGGHFALNMPPSFTDFADLPYRSQALSDEGRNSSGGMGSYYSEVIDDNSQLIHLQFGFPSPSGMVSFFTSFYNSEMSFMASTGKRAPLTYYIGRSLTFVATMNPGVAALMLAAHTIRFLAMEPSGKYYTLKPSMGTYWTRVNTIANIIGINRNLIQPPFDITEPAKWRAPDATDPNNDAAREVFRQQMHNMAPDVFDPDGSINVQSIATRAQRIANRHIEYLDKQMEKAEAGGDIDQTIARIRDYVRSRAATVPTASEKDRRLVGTGEYFNNWSKEILENIAEDPDRNNMAADNIRSKFAIATPEEKKRLALQKSTEELKREQNPLSKWFGEKVDRYGDIFQAHQNDGSMWLTLRVDYTGQHQTTFSNEVGDAEIMERINAQSSKSREARHTISDGNTGIGPVDAVLDYAKAFVTGVTDQLQIAGVMALAGSALVDIQKIWKSSSVDLPSSTFTIKCRPWSGDPMTVLMQQDLLIAALLAAALPLSTGPSSYTSPMYCSLFSRGKFKISEGMITSLTMTRAVSNISNTDDWRDIGVDITFTITDMSSIVHAPISDSFSIFSPISALSNALNNEGAFLDMMASYSGLTLDSVYYNGRRATHAMNRLVTSVQDRFTIEAQMNGLFGDSAVARFFTGSLSQASARAVE